MMEQKYKVGFTCGAFDLCHAGHMLMFKDCKNVCDYLIVGLQVDPSIDRPDKKKPVMSLKERQIILEGNKYIDKIFVYKTEEELYDKLKKLNFDVRILGSDWKNKKYTGWDLSHTPYFHKRDYPYSSSELRQRINNIKQK